MHFSYLALLATFATTAYSKKTSRTFAVNHFYGKGPLTMGRMDPIVNPGKPSGHVHAIQGGNGFALTMTDQQAVKSSCTSSRVKADKSNYWTPALYFQDPSTKKLEAVEMSYMNVYYFFEATDDDYTPFPPGLRIVVGDPTRRTPPKTGGKLIEDLGDGEAQPIQWVCPRSNTNTPLYPPNSDGLHGVGMQDPSNAGAGSGFPDQNCDGYASPLRADVTFPSCWNNATDPSMVTQDNPAGYKFLDTFNNKEAIAFPTNKNCPAGFTHLPKLFYEVYWDTPKFADRWTHGQGNQPFVLANGDPTGYSLHGDFLAGWDTDVLSKIIANCDAGDSGMDKCADAGALNDPSTSCNIGNLVPETLGAVGVAMDALPGNNPVGQWGVPVSGGAPAGGSTVAPTAAQSTAAASSVNVPGNKPPVSSSEANAGTVTIGSTASGPNPTGAPPNPPSNPPAGSAAPQPTTLVTKTGGGVSAPTDTSTPAAPSSGSGSSNGSAVADGWSYKGCYEDTNARVLSGIKLANVGQHAVTNTKCMSYCEARGFSMAGTEYGGQCFCGNSMSNENKLDDSKCAMPCEGDASQQCGGSLALGVYEKSAPKFLRALGRLRRHVEGSV